MDKLKKWTELMISKLTIKGEIVRFHDRDILMVVLPDGTQQPFYKSSGRNSGAPGEWFPFDGLRFDGWFIKTRFVHKGGIKYGGWHRYGNESLWLVSHILGTSEIPEGRIVEPVAEVNMALFGTEFATPTDGIPEFDNVELICQTYGVERPTERFRKLFDSTWQKEEVNEK